MMEGQNVKKTVNENKNITLKIKIHTRNKIHMEDLLSQLATGL